MYFLQDSWLHHRKMNNPQYNQQYNGNQQGRKFVAQTQYEGVMNGSVEFSRDHDSGQNVPSISNTLTSGQYNQVLQLSNKFNVDPNTSASGPGESTSHSSFLKGEGLCLLSTSTIQPWRIYSGLQITSHLICPCLVLTNLFHALVSLPYLIVNMHLLLKYDLLNFCKISLLLMFYISLIFISSYIKFLKYQNN